MDEKKVSSGSVAMQTFSENLSDVKIIKKPAEAEESIIKPGEKRKRDSKRLFNIFNVVFVTAVFVLITAALFVLERSSGRVQSENRNYATFPEFSFNSYLNGEYTQKISEYFTDTTPHREELKTIANAYTELFGFKLDNTVIINSNKNVNKEKFDDRITITTVTPATFPPRENTTSAVTTTTPVATSVPDEQ